MVRIAVGFEEESEREHLGRRCAGAPPEMRKCHEVLAGIPRSVIVQRNITYYADNVQ